MVKVQANESNPDGGGAITKDYDGHFMIESQKLGEMKEGRQSVEVEFVVLNGTVPEYVNKKHSEYFECTGKASGKFLNLAIAAGLTTKDAWRAAKEAGQEMDIDETLLKGRQICASVRMELYGGNDPKHVGKKFPKMAFRTFHVFSDEAKLIPKDADAVSLLGPPPATPPSGSGNGTTANDPTTQATPAASAMDAKW